jgi:signal transduction histidine kinase
VENKVHENVTVLEYFTYFHEQLLRVMPIKNMYVAKYDEQKQSISFPFNIDEIDDELDMYREFTCSDPKQSPTSWVIVHRKELLMDESKVIETPVIGLSWRGKKAHQWYGVPISSVQEKCFGAVVIQSYCAEDNFTIEQLALFKVASTSIARIIVKQALQSRALNIDHVAKIQHLEKELARKNASEKLQKALFKIALISVKNDDMFSFYKNIHSIIDELIYAKNFFIGLVDVEENVIDLPYFIDEKDGDKLQDTRVEIGSGISSYVLGNRKAQLLDVEKYEKMIQEGKIVSKVGADFTSWIGAPMISSTNVLQGIIVIQSYDLKVMYSQSDLELLSFVAVHVANAIETTFNMRQRTESQHKLATQHRLLQESHNDLNKTLSQLKKTQKELIQKEKMASLGGLVAGIAHEINTPLGICVTGVSHLQEEYKIIKSAIENNTLTEENLNYFFEDVEEVLEILQTNTVRGAELVNSFKQVAVDQSSNDVRSINLYNYINDIVLSLRPTLKRSPVDIEVKCPHELNIDVNAGAVSQIISNLILNSIKHGFELDQPGKILIECYEKKNVIFIKYLDNGIGVDEEALKVLFEPFYTTKRGEGGSGLGTQLVYNLVTSVLKGKITVQSQLGKGLGYLIKFAKD